MTVGPPDWDIELQSLRDAAISAGIRPMIDAREFGLQFETADELIARLAESGDPVVEPSVDTRDELSRRRQMRRRVLAASSVAAVGVLVAGVVQPWGAEQVVAATPAILDYEFAAADNISYAPGEDPDATFRSLARAAAGAPSLPADSGVQHVVTDNWYAEFEGDAGAASTALIPQISETWLGEDGSLRLVERRDKPLPPNGRGLPTEGAWTDQPQTADETQGPGSVDPDFVADLSTDPVALRQELLTLSGCQAGRPTTTISMCLYDQVVDLSRTYVLPPEIDAAIWTVLSGEKGFRLLGSVKDRVGRDGVGISLISDDTPEYRRVLIADPEDGSLLGSETILIKSIRGLKIDAPAITSFSAFLEAEYID